MELINNKFLIINESIYYKNILIKIIQLSNNMSQKRTLFKFVQTYD